MAKNQFLIDNTFFGVNPASIEVVEKRIIAKQDVPGREGAVLMDMGSEPARVSFGGKIFDDGADREVLKSRLETLRAKYNSGTAITITAELLQPLNTYFANDTFLIDDFTYRVRGGRPFEYEYSMTALKYTTTELRVNQVFLVNEDAYNDAIFTYNVEASQESRIEVAEGAGWVDGTAPTETQTEAVLSAQSNPLLINGVSATYSGYFGGLWRNCTEVKDNSGQTILGGMYL